MLNTFGIVPPVKSKKAYIGGYISPSLKRQIWRIARAEKRSANFMLEFFLEQGVLHREKELETAKPSN